MSYESLTPRWAHQQVCHDWIVDHFASEERGLMLALPMGVGKSKLAVDVIGQHAANNAERDAPLTRVLILCPLSVVNVWPREFRKHCGADIKVLATNGDIKQRQLQAEYALQEHRSVVVVVHYEAAWREPMASWLLAQKWNVVVADESHKFKALPRYQRDIETGEWKATAGKLAAFMASLGKRAAFRLCLTGTPMAHSPQDIFSQVAFLDLGKRFGASPYHFLARYARKGGYGGKEVIGWTNQQEMSEKYNEIAWTCPPEVVELPEAIHETREFDLCKEAQRAYDEMWSEMVAKVEDGEITAQNGAVAFLRLQQLTSGIGRLDGGEGTVRIDKGKQQLLEDFLDDIGKDEKVVVFCQFRDDLAAVREACETAPGRRYGEISGAAKDGLSSDATYSDGVNCLGVQLQSGGVGIDLTAARYCVYFSPGLSLANYEQSLKRVWRPGQTRPVLFLHLNARGTIDTELYERLQGRKDLVEGILNMARNKEAVAA